MMPIKEHPSCFNYLPVVQRLFMAGDEADGAGAVRVPLQQRGAQRRALPGGEGPRLPAHPGAQVRAGRGQRCLRCDVQWWDGHNLHRD